MDKNSDNEKKLLDYKTELLDLYQNSNINYDKQLVYISAGAIALSIAYFQNLSNNIESHITSVYLILISWISLTITLISNMISHLIAATLHRKTIKDIDEKKYRKEKAKKRNRIILFHNFINIIPFSIGIAAIILFVILNSLS